MTHAKHFLGLVTLFFWSAYALGEPTTSTLEDSLKPKQYVLAVGVSQFQDPLWRDLSFASKDASDINRFFMNKESPFDGGQLIGENGVATKGQILNSIERLADNNRNEEDLVVVYLSTHGTVAYKKDGKVGRYIITSDTDSQNITQTAIDYDELVDRFKSLRSRKKALILAFCHSGVGKSALSPAMKKALAMTKSSFFSEPITERSEGTIILTASGWREPAIEDPALKNDVYTHFLLKGFATDSNNDGAVSIMEAHDFASNETFAFTKGRQRPSAIVELLGSDPIIISGEKKSSGNASLYSLMSQFSGLVVSINNKRVGSLEKGLSIPAGKVRLTLTDKKKAILLDRVVHFEEGMEYSVANLLIPRFLNSLSVGVSVLAIHNDQIRSAYLPKGSTGVNLTYRRDDFVNIYSLIMGLNWFPPVDETIEVDHSAEFDQRRKLATLDLALGNSEKLQWLSTASQTRVGSIYGAARASFLYLNRQVDDEAFEENNGTTIVPGLALTTGLEITFPYYLLKLNFEGGIAAYDKIADEAKRGMIASQLSVRLGTFW
jgi:hypothetical protein